MTTNATTVEDRLAKLGIHLPDAQSPGAKPAGVPTIKPGANTSLGGFNLRRFLHEY